MNKINMRFYLEGRINLLVNQTKDSEKKHDCVEYKYKENDVRNNKGLFCLCYTLKQNTRLNKVFTFQSRNLQKNQK